MCAAMKQGRALRRHDGGFTLREPSIVIIGLPAACTGPNYFSHAGAGKDAGVGSH